MATETRNFSMAFRIAAKLPTLLPEHYERHLQRGIGVSVSGRQLLDITDLRR